MPKNIQLQKNLELTDELTQFILKHPETQKKLPKVVVAIKTKSRTNPWKFESSEQGLATV